jgi:hypothetical protein
MAAPADVIAAAASTWFSRYRLVVSRFTIGSGRPIQATCLQGWFPTPGGPREPGTLLRFGRTSILVSDGRTTQAPRAPQAPRTERLGLVARLALAGCPRILGQRVAARIQSAPPLAVEHAVLAGRPVLALRLPTRGLQISLYLTALTYRPIAVTARESELVGVSRIRLMPLTPTLLRAAGLHP